MSLVLHQKVSAEGECTMKLKWLLLLCLLIQHFLTLLLPAGLYVDFGLTAPQIRRTAQIREGMSPDEVRAILGEAFATETVRSQNGARWRTATLTYYAGTGIAVVVVFNEEERVHRITTPAHIASGLFWAVAVLLLVIAVGHSVVMGKEWRGVLLPLDFATAGTFSYVAFGSIASPWTFYTLRWMLLLPVGLCLLSACLLARLLWVGRRSNRAADEEPRGV